MIASLATPDPIASGFRRRVMRAAAALAGLGLALAGCAATGPAGAGGGSGPLAEAAAPTAQAGSVGAGSGGALGPGGRAIVALLAPTGSSQRQIAEIGRGLADAARLASGDLADPLLELRVYDTRGEASGAKLAAERAIAEGATLIVGPLLSSSVRAAAPVAAAAGVNVIAFSTDPTVAGGNVYLASFLTADEIDRVIGYAASRGMMRYGVLAPSSPLGDVGLAAFRDAVARSRGAVVATGRYESSFLGIETGARDYAAAHTAAEPVDAVLLPEQGAALGTAASFLDYFAVSPRRTRFVGPGTWNDPATLKEIALQGGWFAGADPRIRDAFEQRYEAAYGVAPHRLASLAYDAVAAAGAMLREARAGGSAIPFARDQIVDPAGFVGANGIFRFLPDGGNERGLAVLEVRPGGFAVLDPAPTSFAGL